MILFMKGFSLYLKSKLNLCKARWPLPDSKEKAQYEEKIEE